MKLTGKCKEDFEKWLLKGEKAMFEGFYNIRHPDHFYQLTPSMQFGVIQDFADVIEKKEEKTFLPRVARGFTLFYTTYNGNMTPHKTRNVAREKAIEKFNELYNQQHKYHEKTTRISSN